MKQQLVELIPLKCLGCGKITTYAISSSLKLYTHVACPECAKKKPEEGNYCSAEDCKSHKGKYRYDLILNDGNAVETLYYCEKHKWLWELEQSIGKNMATFVKKAVDFARQL